MRNTQSVRKLKRDPGIVSRMYFTMLLIGIVYGVFAYILMRLGIPLAFIGIIVLGLAIFPVLHVRPFGDDVDRR